MGRRFTPGMASSPAPSNFITMHGKVTSRSLKKITYADEQMRQMNKGPILVEYETRLEFEEKPVIEAMSMADEYDAPQNLVLTRFW